MTITTVEEYKKAVDELNYYTQKYDEGNPEITDEEWDDIYFAVKSYEEETGTIAENSPTNRVNYDVVTSLKKVTHSHPMLSLDKTKDTNLMKKWVGTNKCIVMAKMDGCFVADTMITMGDGTRKKIKDIQVGDVVQSFDERTKQIVNKLVIRTYNNGKKVNSDWIRLKLFSKNNHNNHFYVKTTKNHKFYTPNGWVTAETLSENDVVYCYDYKLSKEQEMFTLGILLGDGWILQRNKNINSYELHWSKTDKQPYNRYFHDVCEYLYKEHNTISKHISGYGSTILDVNFKTFMDLPTYIISSKNKLNVGLTFTKEICNQLTPLSLAVYYLDDGSLIKSQVEGKSYTNKSSRCILHTNRHSKEAVQLFSDYLNSQGYINNIQHEKDIKTNGSGDIIVLTSIGTEKFFDDISKYIPSYLRPIKLGNKSKWQNASEYKWWLNNGNYGLIQGNIIEIKENLSDTNTKSKYSYDLEIKDTHTYFANNFAVHNCTCSITYKNGELVSAETRGNGVVGEDITHNAMVIPSIPKTICTTEETIVIDGEVICKYDDFEEFSDLYKNPRNFASGSVRLMDANECAKRKLTFVAWDIISSKVDFIDKLNLLYQYGMTVVPFEIVDISDFDNQIERMRKLCASCQYPIDGLVYRINNQNDWDAKGRTDHHFAGSMALKFYDELFETELTGITWSVGKTGVITPVATFKPVEIDGTTVKNASLHNLSIMKELLGNPYIGQKIWVFKANQIIPQVAKAEKV